ncbi:amino acid adenylation domain-containing protein [Bradyrhizobium ontarionense]|uniref:Amino acid adenylation domain-containing protein n=1 Tax=Bradyrhizobium ontarionense TaxID=2898149 RepID=A0ABY3R8M3_9BRAD|nr:non-ribosomal peptide synthetase [Bradyrhizobium sp. A19]UFZ03299.1 amino acid adenylation domain-containing protein [Bradyrhizobium sp. A19]
MSGSKVSARISDLSSAQRALLEQRIRGTSSDVGGNESRVQLNIPRRAEGVVTPLSLAQEGLWLLTQAMPDTAAYNNFGSLRLRGELNREALAASLTEVVRRHEVLRTSFGVIDGVPAQVVLASTPLSLEVTDFTGVAKSEQLRVVRNWSTEQGRRPLDLAQGEVFRAHLLQLDVNVHVFLLTVHHIVSDGWSFGLLFRELLLIYNALSQQQDVRLAPLPIQYGDYAAWQRNQLHASHQEMLLAYWREKLHGVPLLLDLPTDRPRPPVRSLEGDWLSFELPPDLTERIRIFCRQQRVTLFMVLLGAYAVLLQRCSGSRDVLIGSPVADRPFPEVEGLIGLFVNTLVFRADFADDPTVAEFISRIRTETVRTYEHRTMPFDSLIGALRIPREQSHSPVFQTMFALQPPRSVPLEVLGLEVEPSTGTYTGSKFDLSLTISELSRGSLYCKFEYSTELFDERTVRRFSERFRTTIGEMVGRPADRVSDLRIMSEDESRKIVEDWNATAAPYPDVCVHDLISEQARRAPDAVALVCGTRHVTYGELDRRSNQLAHYLRQLGIGPDVIVGLSVQRSPEMIVGQLGILKAGGAYLPLDPEYPAARLSFMLENAGVGLVLTHASVVDRLPSWDVKQVLIDKDWPAIATQPEAAPSKLTHPDNLAYVIYTSGSTGVPKGVMATHRATVNRIEAQKYLDPFCATDICCQKTAASFVDSVFEILGPLSSGLPIAVIGENVVRDVDAFVGELQDAGVTRLIVVPSLLKVLLAAGGAPERLKAIRSITTSGEPIGKDLCERVAEVLPGARLINLFGSSEVAGDATGCVLVPGDIDSGIGRPLSNTQAFLLDDKLRPVPIGGTGEIYVGGVGLARGYLRQPRLTAERFVPNPFAVGERLYRTGDLARQRSDGCLQFLSRRDHQVKIRGVRVELGEVEATLRAHPNVGDAVCGVREDEPGDPRIIAFIVARAGSVDHAELRAFAKQTLPEHMLPSRTVCMPELPRLPNGKIDRSALPAPSMEMAAISPQFASPGSDVERTIAEVWREVLKLDRVDIDHNFFDLGGHSILLVSVHSRLTALLPLPVSITTLFQFPTIRSLAAHLTARDGTENQLDVGRARAGIRRDLLASRRAARPGSSELTRSR